MSSAESFPALSRAHAHTLILGSMPGQASLRARRYYAHPRNAFWPIMLAIIGQQAIEECACALETSYEERCHLLVTAGFALWDVLARCERPGSLDSRIVRDSEQANPIAGFVEQHTCLSRIVCNGRTAEKLLQRHCRESLDELSQRRGRKLHYITLPSTSPAMARLSLADKHRQWLGSIVASRPRNF